MPNWKKVITSGSNAHLNQITASSADFNDGNIKNVGQISVDSVLADTDSNVNISLGTSGINFDVNNGDEFLFNNDEKTADLRYIDVNGATIFQIDQSLQRTTIGDVSQTAKSTLMVEGDITSTNITASGNISASGTMTMLTASIGGGIFTSASLAAGGGGGGAVSAVANGSNNRVATFSSGDALNGEANLTFDGSTLSVTGNQTISTHITASGNISASGNAGIIGKKFNLDNDSNSTIVFNGDDGLSTVGKSGDTVKFGAGGDWTEVQIGRGADALKNILVHGHITASGDISSSGDVFTNQLSVQGNTAVSYHAGSNSLLFSETGLGTGIKGSSISFTAASGPAPISSVGHITASGNISASGTGSFSSIVTSGNINTSADLFVDDITADDITADKIITDEIDATSNGNLTIDVGEDSSVFITMDDGSTTPFEFKTAAGGSPTQELGITGNFLLDTSGDITLDAAGDQINFKDNGSTRLTFNLDSTPELDVTGDFIIDGSGGIKLDSATSKIEMVGNITGSGHISMSGGQSHRIGGKLEVPDRIMTTNIYEFTTGTGVTLQNNITASGDISASGTITANSIVGTSSVSNNLTIGTGLDLNSGTTFNGSAARTLNIDITEIISTDGANRVLTSDGDGTLTAEDGFTYNGTLLSFQGGMTANSANDDAAFQVKGSSDDNLLQVNPTSNDRVGIGTANPTKKLQVSGDISSSGTHFMATASIGGGIFTSASLASLGQSGGGGGASALNDLSDVSYSSGDLTISSLDKLVVGSFEIDSSGDITLDAAGDDILFKDAGSTRFTFNLDSTPEIDVTGDFTIDGSGDIKLDSATNVVDLTGNVTGSNDISASGDIFGSLFYSNNVLSLGYLNNVLNIGPNLLTPVKVQGHLTASGNISGSSILTTEKLNVNPKSQASPNMALGNWNISYGTATELSGSLASNGNGYGEIAYFGSGTLTAGRVYCLKSDLSWEIADVTGAVSSSLLCVAMGSNPTVDGVLLRGIVKGSAHDSHTAGQQVFNQGGGRFAATAGSSAGDVVRVLGYSLNTGGSAHIYFNPDNTFIERS